MPYTRETADTSWASPGAEGVVIQLARAAGESPRILHRVTIARIGKRDLVATDARGVEHRFRVADVDAYGFRTAAKRSAWAPSEVLVSPESPIAAVAKASTAASHEYASLARLFDKLRHERTPEVAEEVAQAATWLAATLRVVENVSAKVDQ